MSEGLCSISCKKPEGCPAASLIPNLNTPPTEWIVRKMINAYAWYTHGALPPPDSAEERIRTVSGRQISEELYESLVAKIAPCLEQHCGYPGYQEGDELIRPWTDVPQDDDPTSGFVE